MEKKEYEKPEIMETMSIEDVLMDEEIAPEWINWKQSWNNSWNNKAIVPQKAGEPIKGGEK